MHPNRNRLPLRLEQMTHSRRAAEVLSGTVLDTNRDVLQGARVTLVGLSGSVIRTVESGSNGQFAFTGLAPDIYKLTVTAPGMSTFTSTQIPLHAGEARIVPAVTLSGFRRDHQCDRDWRKQGGTG